MDELENCGQIKEEIDILEDNIPDKRTKEYEIWKEKINILFDKYNSFVNFAAYKKIQ